MSVFAEIRRRKLLRVVGLYVVGAWVVLQVADLAFPGLGIPDSAIRYVWVGAIACFPLALLLGWYYDVSGTGLSRTPATADALPRPLGGGDAMLLGGLGLAAMACIGFVVVNLYRSVEAGTPSLSAVTAEPRSIAVLPFENLSADESNAAFVSGIHDDVLTHIAKIGDIRVISRTSVERLGSRMGIREIGRVLGVATVLQGGVQRVGDQVRINAQLIDVESDQHLWAETFDRVLTPREILDIQTAIAQAIAEKLDVTLSARQRATLERAPTQSLEAYQAYLQGRGRMNLRTYEGLQEAERYFRLALEHDPNYALAYVGLADANTIMAAYGLRSTADASEISVHAIDAALEIDDRLGAAHAAMGVYLSSRARFDLAERSFKRAIELDRNYAPAYHWYGDMLVNGVGDPRPAVKLLNEARHRDPLSPIIVLTLGEAHEALGEFERAQALYRQSIELEPGFASGYLRMALLNRLAFGRVDEAVRWHIGELNRDPSRSSAALGFAYLELGDDVAAERWIDHALETVPNNYFSKLGPLVLHLYRDEPEKIYEAAHEFLAAYPGDNMPLYALAYLGRFEEALSYYENSYPGIGCDGRPAVDARSFFLAINYSLALEKTGQTRCARQLLDAAQQQIDNMQRGGLRGYSFADVEIYARQGKSQLALAALEKAIDEGIRASWWMQLERSPHVASIADMPEFQRLLEIIRNDMASQLANVRGMAERGELAVEPLAEP